MLSSRRLVADMEMSESAACTSMRRWSHRPGSIETNGSKSASVPIDDENHSHDRLPARSSTRRHILETYWVRLTTATVSTTASSLLWKIPKRLSRMLSKLRVLLVNSIFPCPWILIFRRSNHARFAVEVPPWGP